MRFDGDVNPNRLEGTPGDDTIYAGGGNDTIFGLGGNDLLEGGPEYDLIYGGAGNDTLRDSRLFVDDGTNNRSRLYGGDGSDYLTSIGISYGGAGDDYISVVEVGGPGVPPPLLFGGTGVDRFLLGETVIDGTRIDGNGGADRLMAGTADVTVDLRKAKIASIEVLDFSGPRFFATERGIMVSARQFGAGIATDVTVIGGLNPPSNLAERVVVAGIDGGFSAGAWQFQGWGTRREFVDLRGGGGNDTITGSSVADLIAGNGGKDRLTGGLGNDTLSGGLARDVLFGGAGNDSLSGGLGPDRLDGGAGDDTMTGGAGPDQFVIRSGRDVVTDFDAGSDTLAFARADWGGAGQTVAGLLALAAPVGGDLVLTFAADTTLRLVGVTDVAALAGSVELI